MRAKKKFRLEICLPWDGAYVAQRLEKMARKGWQLEKVGNLFWTYRKAEPAALHYAITYFPDASVFDSAPTEDQESYADYCAAAGWQMVSTYGPLQIFVNDRPDPVPIETDEGEKLTAIHKAMRKMLFLPYGTLAAVWIFNLALRLNLRSYYSTLSTLSSVQQLLFLLAITLLILLSLGMMGDYLVWYLRSRRSVDRGGACLPAGTRVRRILQWLPVAAYAVYGLVLLWAMAAAGRVLYLLALAGGTAVLVIGTWGLLRLLKRRNRQADESVVIALAVCVGLIFLAILGSSLIPLSPL